MSRARKDTALRAADIDIKRFAFQRIRIDKQGYDETGAYWGAGPDAFIATSPNRVEEVTVRAQSLSAARIKVVAQLVHTPGETPTQRDKLGGASAHVSRYEFDWRDPGTDSVVRIGVKHERDYLGQGQDHVEITSLRPRAAPLPITETGYKSHFIAAIDLINAGGPVTLVTAWLDAEARSKAWQRLANTKAQGDLFKWAETKKEVAKRRPVPRARRPDVKAKNKHARAHGKD